MKKKKKSKIRASWEDACRLMLTTVDSFREEHLRGIDHLVNTFISRKKKFIPYFNNDLRIEKSINDDLENISKEDIEFVFNLWRNEKGHRLFNNKQNLKSKLTAGYTLALDFVINNLLELEVEEIKEGRLLRKMPTKEGKTLNKNTKASKYILAQFEERGDYLFKGFNSYDIENKELVRELILDFYSQLISSLKGENHGKIVLSINPVDYMLCSAATNGDWRSCHNYYDGAHRLGGFSYSLDCYTLIAYSYRDKKTHNVGSFNKEVRAKTWRQMIAVDTSTNSALFFKDYPEPKPLFHKHSRKVTGELLSEMTNTEPVWNVSFNEYSSGVLNNEEQRNYKSTELLKESHFHYQDSYTSKIWLKRKGEDPRRIYLGAPSILCPFCGKNYLEDGKNSYICKNCLDNLTKCYECGTSIFLLDDKVKEDEDGYHYCPNCYDTLKSKCSDCEKEVVKYNLVNIELSDGTKKEVCTENCFDNYGICTHCGIGYKTSNENCEDGHCEKCSKKKRKLKDSKVTKINTNKNTKKTGITSNELLDLYDEVINNNALTGPTNIAPSHPTRELTEGELLTTLQQCEQNLNNTRAVGKLLLLIHNKVIPLGANSIGSIHLNGELLLSHNGVFNELLLERLVSNLMRNIEETYESSRSDFTSDEYHITHVTTDEYHAATSLSDGLEIDELEMPELESEPEPEIHPYLQYINENIDERIEETEGNNEELGVFAEATAREYTGDEEMMTFNLTLTEEQQERITESLNINRERSD